MKQTFGLGALRRHGAGVQLVLTGEEKSGIEAVKSKTQTFVPLLQSGQQMGSVPGEAPSERVCRTNKYQLQSRISVPSDTLSRVSRTNSIRFKRERASSIKRRLEEIRSANRPIITKVKPMKSRMAMIISD